MYITDGNSQVTHFKKEITFLTCIYLLWIRITCISDLINYWSIYTYRLFFLTKHQIIIRNYNYSILVNKNILFFKKIHGYMMGFAIKRTRRTKKPPFKKKYLLDTLQNFWLYYFPMKHSVHPVTQDVVVRDDNIPTDYTAFSILTYYT